jgi:hypothetical protein
MGEDSLASRAEMEAPPWAPSAALRQTLGVGIGATLATALLLVTQSALAHAQAPAGVLHVLGWLALVPAFWIVVAYARLGAETRYRSLLASSVGLFITLVLLQLFDLVALDVLPWYGQIPIWIILVLGLIVVVLWPFMTNLSTPTGQSAEQQAADAAACQLASGRLRPEQRVLGHYYQSGRWYAGTLQSIAADGFHIVYDDGDTETVPGECIRAEELTDVEQLEAGQRVLARWWRGDCYYPGAVTATRPGEVHIHYDDGSDEWSKLPVVRLSGTSADSPESTAGQAAPKTGGSLVGKVWSAIITVVAAIGIILLRGLGKGVARFAFRRGGIAWLETAGMIVVGALVVAAGFYFIWFAVAKMLARSRLGTFAILVGLAELLGLATALAMIGWFFAEMAAAGGMDPGIADAQIDNLAAQRAAQLAPLEALVIVGWAALTMGLFWSIRGRITDEPEASATDKTNRR